MTFQDLPENLRQTPLDTPALRADTVGLFLDLRDRADDTLFLGLCDEAHRLVQPMLLAGVEWRDERRRRRLLLQRFAQLAASTGMPAVLLGISSMTRITPPLAALWRHEAGEAFEAAGVELLGVCLADRHRVVEIEAPALKLAVAEPAEVVEAAARITADAA